MTDTQAGILEEAHARMRRDPLTAWIGVRLDGLEPGRVASSMTAASKHVAPNGFLHAGVSITLADVTCATGSFALLYGTDARFTTIELKTNHLGTATEGLLRCTAIARHIGSSTHVWDADVIAAATGKPIMVFRCTQMVLRPR